MNKNKPDIKSVYFWNLLGNIFVAAVSVLYLLVVSRLLSTNKADQFSLAYAIGNLWVIIGLFQVRNYQGTDVKDEYQFVNYAQARLFSVFIMLATIVPYTMWLTNVTYTQEMIFLIFLVICYRATDAVSDLFQGLFQQHERLDIAGKSMVFRYIGCMVLFSLGLAMTASLFVGISLILIWSACFILFYEVPRVSGFVKIEKCELFSIKHFSSTVALLRQCTPLFINGFLLNYVFNEPKLVIEQGLLAGILPTGMQRDFNILFMPVFFMSLCILVARPLITQMAKLWQNHQEKAFYRVLIKMMIYIACGSILVTGIAYVFGIPVLNGLFGVTLDAYILPFCVLVLAGGIYSLAIILENVLTIFRKQRYLVIVYVSMFVMAKVITAPLINTYKMLGASLSFFIIMLLYAVGVGSLTLFCQRRKL